MATVEDLYKYWEVLDADKNKIAEHEEEFTKVLLAVKGGPSEKKLASQLIGRFFKYFPKTHEQALNAMFDLCEDDDVAIRKTAIRDLPSLCKDTPEFTSRIADVLTQLFQADEPDQSEVLLLHTALLSVLRTNFQGAISGIFTQIDADEPLIREKAIQFLAKKITNLSEDILNKDNEDFLMNKCKEALKDVSGSEFLSFMQLLSKLKVCQTVQGRQQLSDIVYDQLDGGQEFKADDPDCVDRVRQCLKQALPYFSKNVHSTRYVEYLCDNVLPVLSQIKKDQETDDVELEILKILAEISPHCTKMDEVLDRVEFLFVKLLEYMPLPPQTENGETEGEAPQLLFSLVECLLITFHQLARQCPEFLTDPEHAERLKDFKIRLQYFAFGSQAYFKQLKASVKPKPAAERTDEDKIKIVALKVTMNINALIRDLMHVPPSYKAEVTPSWKPAQKQPTTPEPVAKKRLSSESTNVHDKKSSRNDRAVYAPPTGKFSEKAGQYRDEQGRVNRGRQRGGFRGRGRGRGGGYY